MSESLLETSLEKHKNFAIYLFNMESKHLFTVMYTKVILMIIITSNSDMLISKICQVPKNQCPQVAVQYLEG